MPQEDWRRNLYVLTLVQLVMRVANTSLKPFIPLYLPELGVTVPEQVAFWAGVATSVNFIAQTFTQPVWGNLADRYGKKPMVVRSIAAVGGFNLLVVWAADIYQFVTLRFLMGTMAGFHAAAVALVATQTPSPQLGYAVGLVQAGQMAGTILGPGLGGVLAEVFGYRGAFTAAGALSLAMVPLVVWGVQEERPRGALTAPPSPPAAAVGETHAVPGWDEEQLVVRLRDAGSGNRLMLAALLVIGCSQFGTQSADSLMALFVQAIYPGPRLNLVVSLAFALAAASNLLMAPFWGRYGDRRGRWRVLRFTLGGMALTVALQAFSRNAAEFLVLRTLAGFFAAGVMPNAHAVVGELSPEARRGRAYGVAGSALAMGNFAGPMVGGIVAALIDIRAVFWVTAVLLVLVEIATWALRRGRA